MVLRVCIAVASLAEEIEVPAAFGLAFFVVFFEEFLLIRDFFVTAIVFSPRIFEFDLVYALYIAASMPNSTSMSRMTQTVKKYEVRDSGSYDSITEDDDKGEFLICSGLIFNLRQTVKESISGTDTSFSVRQYSAGELQPSCCHRLGAAQ